MSALVNTCFHLSGRRSFYRSCLDCNAAHMQKAKTLCFIEIQDLLSSEQWFLDFGDDAVMFVKVAQTLLQHICRKQQHFVSLQSNKCITLILFLDFWKGFQEYKISPLPCLDLGNV